MILLDHTVLRTRDNKVSARFYARTLGFGHEGSVGPFEVLRVNDHLTLDLVQQAPRDAIHLAFAMTSTDFERVKSRLASDGVPFGNSPHDRVDSAPAPAAGARGMADALYFDDPDGHIVEIRRYDEGGLPV